MSYSSGAAFRRALEDRLLAQSRESGVALVRLRKLVAFDRLLARLAAAEPGQWLLKGGVALQLRLGSLARTTRDMDLLLASPCSPIYAALAHAAHLELADWFEFTVAPARDRLPGVGEGGLRFPVTALLDGRVFESFHVDVGSGEGG
jgi:Nucleotidyl transferase AbiEii toxin, Type IV TA system